MAFHKVTMQSRSLAPDGSDVLQEASDYVRDDILDIYVEDARKRWQAVTTGPDDRPAAEATAADYLVPAHLETEGA